MQLKPISLNSIGRITVKTRVQLAMEYTFAQVYPVAIDEMVTLHDIMATDEAFQDEFTVRFDVDQNSFTGMGFNLSVVKHPCMNFSNTDELIQSDIDFSCEQLKKACAFFGFDYTVLINETDEKFNTAILLVLYTKFPKIEIDVLKAIANLLTDLKSMMIFNKSTLE